MDLKLFILLRLFTLALETKNAASQDGFFDMTLYHREEIPERDSSTEFVASKKKKIKVL